MALDMRALYYVALPTERSEADDVQRHEEDIKANENCLNQNFSALAQKIYEFEARIALLGGCCRIQWRQNRHRR